ncbi:MAG: hypothetical protein IPP69_11445 [Flavobacteriales bacterium]|nr:hypothetical protein [Flavobacteriales bacterium]
MSTVEHPDNPIEIVIHVNMLAEGWDVTNLYTICPLRKADSIKLVEQTIGRGLRLPYGGERTHVDKVDKLTVVAHENFTQVINAAKEPGSILQKFTYVEIEHDQLTERTEVITSSSKVNIEIRNEAETVAKIANEEEKQKATVSLDAKRTILEAIKDAEIIHSSGGLNNFEKPEVKAKVIAKAVEIIETGQQDIFKESIVEELPNVYERTLVQFRNSIIEIPKSH